MTKDFWQGFIKRADGIGAGGSFSGAGKGNLPTGYAEQGMQQGNLYSDGKTDMELLDRQRNPKDFKVGEYGEDAPSEVNPHIIY